MKIKYKEPKPSPYQPVLDVLRREFPGRTFRIRQVCAGGHDDMMDLGIEERVSLGRWRELDLKAMGLL